MKKLVEKLDREGGCHAQKETKGRNLAAYGCANTWRLQLQQNIGWEPNTAHPSIWCLASPQHSSCVTKTEILAQILYWSEYFSFCWQRRCKKLAKQLLNRVDCTTILGTLAVSVAWHPKTLVPLNWHISSVFNQNSGALNIVVGIGFPLFSESFEILLCQC